MAIERVQVLKFGGTSVGGPDSFQQSSHVVEMHRDNSAGALVVVSAMAGVTDLLMQAYNFAVAQDPSQALKIIDEIHGRHRLVLDQIAGKRSSQEAITKVDSVALTIRDVLTAVASLGDHYPKLRDKVVSAGEMMSPWLLATQLEAMDVPVKVFDAGEIMVTDGRFGDANPDLEATIERVDKSILPTLKRGSIGVIGGYFGRDKQGHLTTFGRGGSDRTATILAKVMTRLAVTVPGVYLYKADVGGVMSADPKIVPEAHIVSHLTGDEAAALAKLGGKVLHPKAVSDLRDTKVPIYCRSTSNPDGLGTVIDHQIQQDDLPVKVITALWPLLGVKIEGPGMDRPNIAGQIFQMLGRQGIDVRSILQPITEQSMQIFVSSTVDETELVNALLELLHPYKTTGDIQTIDTEYVSAVGVIGSKVNHRETLDGVTRALFHNGDGRSGEHVLTVATSPSLCSVIFERDKDGNQARIAVQSLHHELLEGN